MPSPAVRSGSASRWPTPSCSHPTSSSSSCGLRSTVSPRSHPLADRRRAALLRRPVRPLPRGRGRTGQLPRRLVLAASVLSGLSAASSRRTPAATGAAGRSCARRSTTSRRAPTTCSAASSSPGSGARSPAAGYRSRLRRRTRWRRRDPSGSPPTTRTRSILRSRAVSKTPAPERRARSGSAGPSQPRGSGQGEGEEDQHPEHRTAGPRKQSRRVRGQNGTGENPPSAIVVRAKALLLRSKSCDIELPTWNWPPGLPERTGS